MTTSLIKSDVLRWRPYFKILSFLKLLLLQPGFQLVFLLRLQRQLLKLPFIGRPLAIFVWYVTCVLTGSECSLSATLGCGLFIPHPFGIVIGSGSVIGNNVSIYQGVTLGRKNQLEDAYPTIEDNACLYAGAKILGPIRIGRNAIIGANAVVTKDVPDNMIAFGVPAKTLSRGDSDDAV